MLVTFDLRYRARVVPERRRRSVDAWETREVAVEVREFSEDEVPVVLETRFEPYASMGNLEPFRVRSLDGLLFRPSTVPGTGGGSAAERSMRGALSQAARALSLSQDDHGTRDRWSSGSGPRLDVEGGGHRTERSSFESAMAHLQMTIDAGFVLVGGRPFRIAGAPMVSVADFETGFGERGRELAGMTTGSVVCAWTEPAAAAMAAAARHLPMFCPHAAGEAMRRLEVRVLDSDLLAACRARSVSNTDLGPALRAALQAVPAPHDGTSGVSPPVGREAENGVAAGLAAAARHGGHAPADLAGAWEAALALILPSPARNVPETGRSPRAGDGRIAKIMIPFLSIHHHERDSELWYSTGGSARTDHAPAVVRDLGSMPPTVAEVSRGAGRGTATVVAGKDGWHVLSQAVVGRRRSHKARIVEHAGDPDGRRGSYSVAALLADEAWHLGQTGTRERYDPVFQLAVYGREVLPSAGASTDGFKKKVLAEYADARLGMFGDRLACACPEPYVVVRARGSEAAVDISVSWSDRQLTVPGQVPPYLFRLDRWDEARALAGRFGMQVAGAARPPEVHDASGLRFDGTAWNLKAALCSILAGMDGRIGLLDGETVVAVGRLARILGEWRLDASAAGAPGVREEIAEAADRLLAVLDDPAFDGIGRPAARETASECLAALAVHVAASPDEDDAAYAGLSM